MITICLDAGHGGTDPGAVNGGKREKDITLNLALKVGALIGDKVNVIYSRNNDTFIPLGNRCKISNNNKCDYFVSIHVNSAENKSAFGIETFTYTVPGDKASKLAKNVQTNLIKATASKDRGIKTANYYVLKHTIAPAILIEVGFISNEVECKKLCSDDYQYKLAKAIADGILNSVL